MEEAELQAAEEELERRILPALASLVALPAVPVARTMAEQRAALVVALFLSVLVLGTLIAVGFGPVAVEEVRALSEDVADLRHVMCFGLAP